MPEINVFIDKGVGHIKYVLPDVIPTKDENGNDTTRPVTPEDAVTVYTIICEAVTNQGHELGREAPRQFGGKNSAPKEEAKPPEGVPVWMHCGQEAEFKPAWTNREGKKIGAKFQCRNENCPDKALTGYKASVFLDRWMKMQQGA